MLLIYITLIAMLALAKHPKRRRRMGRYIRGSVDEQLNLGTLAGQTLVSQIFDETVNERTLVTSIVANYTLRLVTPINDLGPVMVGVAHSDYTDAEIEAVIEASGSWDEGDLVQQEISKRKVRRIGIFEQPENATQAVVLNDGRMIRTKLNWILLQGQSLRLWAYNMGQAMFATTAPDLNAAGHVNLFPK